MYLVGDFTFPKERLADGEIVLKRTIDKDDLARCKDNEDRIVIDLYTKKYFDAEENIWRPIKII